LAPRLRDTPVLAALVTHWSRSHYSLSTLTLSLSTCFVHSQRLTALHGSYLAQGVSESLASMSVRFPVCPVDDSHSRLDDVACQALCCQPDVTGLGTNCRPIRPICQALSYRTFSIGLNSPVIRLSVLANGNTTRGMLDC